MYTGRLNKNITLSALSAIAEICFAIFVFEKFILMAVIISVLFTFVKSKN